MVAKVLSGPSWDGYFSVSATARNIVGASHTRIQPTSPDEIRSLAVLGRVLLLSNFAPMVVLFSTYGGQIDWAGLCFIQQVGFVAHVTYLFAEAFANFGVQIFFEVGVLSREEAHLPLALWSVGHKCLHSHVSDTDGRAATHRQ